MNFISLGIFDSPLTVTRNRYWSGATAKCGSACVNALVLQ